MSSNYMCVTFKTPDTVDLALEQELAAQDELKRDKTNEGFTEEELYELELKWQAFLDSYVKYGEYVTLKFDLDEQTVTVVPVRG